MDRFYVKDLENNVTETQNHPVSWSDHNIIKTCIKLNNDILIGKGYWRLNCNILTQDVVVNNVKEICHFLKSKLTRATMGPF